MTTSASITSRAVKALTSDIVLRTTVFKRARAEISQPRAATGGSNCDGAITSVALVGMALTGASTLACLGVGT